MIEPLFAAAPVPIAFRAATLNEYAWPFVKPANCTLVFVEENTCGVFATFPRYGVTT
jgi:hypothetical protein